MTPPPARPKIYHITHIDNLSKIVTDGQLLSDAAVLERLGRVTVIGMSGIKRRRLYEIEVSCHAGTKVGEYVPFYFCPRSVMLCLIHYANHPELSYRGGQDPIVHLEADFHGAIRWGNSNGVPWAFSLSNAGARYVQFRSAAADLNQINWVAVAARDFRDSDVKEGKQAEFLMFGYFPFHLIQRIGVRSAAMKSRVERVLAGTSFSPTVEVLPDWYF